MKKKILIAFALSIVVSFSTQKPAFADENAVTDVDNTRMNKEILENNEVSADQQKENASDLKITQQIRRAIIKNKSLSLYAHNVKIITLNGAVTLKGPVSTSKEKLIIEKAAVRVAGKNHVTSELEVKPKE